MATLENSVQVLIKLNLFPTTNLKSPFEKRKRKTYDHKNICILLYLAVLFTIVKNWHRPNVPSIFDQIIAFNR